MTINRANVAVQLMRHLCTCESHGYSQPGRYGTSGYCSVVTDAGTIQVKRGDRDCSSAVCEAWELALAGTPYEGRITRYNWTGSMEDAFVGSGLFERKPMSFSAEPGDIYLDVDAHTAMCIQNDGSADLLGEFSISETGGIDGEPGDQTGCESSVHGYYEAWDFILHYNHKADAGGSGSGSGGPASGGSSSKGDLPIPKYRVAVKRNGKKKWLGWLTGLKCSECSDDFAGIEGEPIVDVEFDPSSLGDGGWFKKHMAGGKLVALTVYYGTPEPEKTGYYLARYRVHWGGSNPQWGKWELDDTDDYAGNMEDPIDMVQCMIVKA